MDKKQFTNEEKIEFFLGRLDAAERALSITEYVMKKEIAFLKAKIDQLKKEIESKKAR